MQRVLSIQTSRGFGESSEFITKRSCISFLFSIGFLCLLGGFMLGRFATHRTIMVRAEKERLQLASNGLEMTERLQNRVFSYLQNANFYDDLSINKNLDKSSGVQTSVQSRKEIFSGLELISEVFEFKSCTVAKVQGVKEPDRYVVISLKEKRVLIELIKSLNEVHEEREWSPRRTILFCTCENSSIDCFHELPNFMQSKIVAFLTKPDKFVKDSYNSSSAEEGCLLVSGTNIAEAAVQQAADSMRKFNSNSPNLCDGRQLISVPRLNLDIPHAEIHLVDENSSRTIRNHSLITNRRIIAQVISLSIWRLSEGLILPWNPNRLNEMISQSVRSLQSSESADIEKRLIQRVGKYKEKLSVIEPSNSLDVRIANDQLLDIDNNFSCLDFNHHQHQSSQSLKQCFENLNGILQV